jgi:hypothetical protein
MAVKKPVVNKKKTNIVTPKSNAELLGSIDVSLKSINDFLQGEFFEKIESLDWKVWELHNRAEKNDKVLEILEDVKSLLRVHLMNDGSQSSLVEEVGGKPKSIIGKLFKK